MADRCNRFSGIEESLREGNCVPKRVRVDNAARQQQRVEIFRLGSIEPHIDRQLYAPVRENPRPYAMTFGRYVWVVPPASSRASRGSVSSTCSKPSVTRMATLSPLRVSFAMI